jgi:hypothetical protein
VSLAMLKQRKVHLAAILFAISLFVFTGMLSLSCSSGQKPLFSDLDIKHSMTVQKFSGSNNSVAIVSGTAVNRGKESIEIVSLVATFIDSNGKTVDQSSAVTSNLAPGGTWNFTIQSMGPDAWKIVKYTLTQSTSK